MRIVAALGGNALLERGQVPDARTQIANVGLAAAQLAALAEHHELVITHGNGPQVGVLALESANDERLSEPYPFDTLGAQTQGMIGYWLLQAMQNALPGRQVASMVNQTLVLAGDPAFANPTKFVGEVYTKDEAQALADTPSERQDAQEWLEAAVVLSQDSPPSPVQRELIHEALVNLANTTKDPSERTLTHFCGTVQDSGLRRLLQYYTGDRPGGLLLDGESNDIRYRNFTVFELDRVWNLDRKLVIPIFLFLFREIEKRLDATMEGRYNPPTLIVIDEA